MVKELVLVKEKVLVHNFMEFVDCMIIFDNVIEEGNIIVVNYSLDKLMIDDYFIGLDRLIMLDNFVKIDNFIDFNKLIMEDNFIMLYNFIEVFNIFKIDINFILLINIVKIEYFVMAQLVNFAIQNCINFFIIIKKYV